MNKYLLLIFALVISFQASSLTKENFQTIWRPLAEQGDSEAQFRLGLMYDYDQELEDDKQAIKWYRKAAEQGHVKAQYFIGLSYYTGFIRLEYVC